MLHRRCESQFAEHRKVINRQAQHNRLARLRVLGRHFDEKLKFLKAEGDLVEREFHFIHICHKLRNEAYHQGLTRDEILFPLAWEYHSLACDLFARWPPLTTSRGANGEPPLSERFSKHLKTDRAGKRSSNQLVESVGELASSLRSARIPLTRPLNATLTASLLDRIGLVEEQMEFLVRDSSNRLSRSEMLRVVQFNADLLGEIPLEIDEHSAWEDYILQKDAKMRSDWRPKRDSLPFKSWRARAERIRTADRYSALQRYDQLSIEMEYLADAIAGEAYVLESNIQQMVDFELESQAFGEMQTIDTLKK
jgi:hypothetical protein